MRITRLTTDHLRVPLEKPNRLPLTDPLPDMPDAVELLLVQVETDAHITGLGFTYLLGPGAAAVRSLLEDTGPALVVGQDPRETDRLLAQAEAVFRPVGFAGLAARAYSAIDVALWDVKAKAAGLPLARLLGGWRSAAPFFVSDLTGDVVKASKPLLKQGAMGVRIEIGRGDVQADAERVRAISDGLGDEAWIGVAAEGRFDRATAQALAHFFEDIGIDWFEDPIPAADEIGYAQLAAQMETPLAVGNTFNSREAFFRVIRAGHVRTVRPDVCRLGGITPLLKVAAVAEAYQVAVSPVRLPEIGVHLACGLGVVSHVDSVAWFREVFCGGPRLEGGKLVPGDEAGLGLQVNEPLAAKWRVAG
jgi:L-alanine-DL-glutamate epimerase-like enolase superfamily enzyme